MTISTTRRKVLALLGVAPAAPLAAKAAMEKQLADMSGVELGKAIPVGSPYTAPPNFGSSDFEATEQAAIRYFDMFGVPEHIEEQWYERSKRVEAIDPDIAIKCWSYNVKVQSQRERNRKAMRVGLKNEITRSAKAKAFRGLTGFSWPFFY